MRPSSMAASSRIPERLRWTLELLAVEPAEHVFEIGCGPGHAVALVAAQLTRGTITAIDRSATMIARARVQNAAAIEAGRVRLEQRALAAAAPGRRFGKVFAVNVNAFWTEPGPSLAALRRLLQPGGRAWLVYEPPSLARLRALEQQLPSQFEAHGFQVAEIYRQPFRASHGLCIVARPAKPSGRTSITR